MHSLDLSVFNVIYSVSGHSAWLDALIILCGTYLLYIILATLIILAASAWYLAKRQQLNCYLLAFAGAIIARFGIEPIIHFFYYRPRPFLALHIPHLITDTTSSFPSGHTIFIFALATGLLYVNKRMAHVFFIVGLLVGLARIAGGVHYPSDILGGAVLGIFTALVVQKVWQRWGIGHGY